MKQAVSIIGAGAMGSAIASRLLGLGYPVTVWNRTAARVEPLAAQGATVAGSPAAAVSAARVSLVLVSDAAAALALTTAADGIAAADLDGRVVVQMSTIGVPGVVEQQSRLPAGVLLDAPVLGSVGEAAGGTLTVLVGGDAAVVNVGRTVLADLGAVVEVGAVGAGQAAKLVVNAGLFAVIAALGESVALADALGLDREVTYDVLAHTALAAQAERRREVLDGNNSPPRFALPLAHKDAALARAAAVAAGRPDLRVLASAGEWLDQAMAAGLDAADYSAILGHIVRAQA
ncbi:MAG: 3-hydroxyisobutyrate dehydrogenase [Frankiaceae bacterium]|jgi:3-hydroxyisobutyrate dehydrogenase-like beta-hydroxyacid dehydrogenase|nr:3-hydroxyisobutyrate dehydrogenase [Frankiaceae bacterium]